MDLYNLAKKVVKAEKEIRKNKKIIEEVPLSLSTEEILKLNEIIEENFSLEEIDK